MVVEASSASTALSEACFATLLGLRFVAVMPSTTSSAKVTLTETQGIRCHFVQNSSEVFWVEPSFLPGGAIDGQQPVARVQPARRQQRPGYQHKYVGDAWVSVQRLDPTGPAEALPEFERSCRWT